MNWLFQAAKTGRIKSLAQAIREFFNMNGRMPSVRERNTMGSILQDITQKSNVIDLKTRLTYRGKNPQITKKADKDPSSTMYDRHTKEIESLDTTKGGLSFYTDLGNMMKRHRREELESAYDEMYNKILEKAKRIESDPLPLLEAELGTKLTGKETTTQLLDLFSKRPKKASGGIAGQLHLNRPGYKSGTLVKLFNLLKGAGKKKTDFTRLFRGDTALPYFKRNKESMKNLADYLGVPVKDVEKHLFSSQWFSTSPSMAKSYMAPHGLGVMKYADLTKKEFEALKKFKTKINKIKTFPKSDIKKTPVSDTDRIQIIPRIKLKKLKEEGRLKTKPEIFGPVKTKKENLFEGYKDDILRYVDPKYIKKAKGGRIGYAKGTKKLGEGQYSPIKDKAWMQTMPKIDPNLRKLMEEYKKRKGLAEILGV